MERALLLSLALRAVASSVAATSLPASPSTVRFDCETGILDPGEDGMNVLIYELCPDRLTIGFRSSDVIEEVSCRPGGDIQLWQMTQDARCGDLQATDQDRILEIRERLRGVGRTTSAPVRKQLTCHAGGMNSATIVVPNARKALLDTRKGDTTYEKLTRRLIAGCIRPNS